MNIPTTDLPLAIKNKISSIDIAYDENTQYLQNFQYVIREYYIKSINRGLLVYHDPGAGKTITAVAVSDYYRKHQPKRKLVIILSKSLKANFAANIKKYMRNNPDNTAEEKTDTFIQNTIDKYYFISLNASNMFEQVLKIGKGADHKFLENSLLIIDEAHNFSNSIVNGSKNAVQLYEVIMKTKNIKLLFLTGTPIINTPFELVPIFNMLKGEQLFPENIREFYNFFVKEGKLKNRHLFQNRIFNMVTYYGDYLFGSELKQGFPEQKPTIFERVPMSIPQFSKYDEAREREKLEETTFRHSEQFEMFTVKEENVVRSYRIKSRQISNYLIPEYTDQIDKIKISDLKDLDKYSPKFKKILENIRKHDNQLGIVYSEFVKGGGLGIFARVLETMGYIAWGKYITRQLTEETDEFDIGYKSGGDKKTYALITGNIPFVERNKVIEIFNSRKNLHGEKIQLLLISRAGAEGLSLKNVRHIHIMEPFWNYARIEQVIARGVRYMSHTQLPEDERNVQPYVYISSYPEDYNPRMVRERTTDNELLHLALLGKKLRQDFERALVEVSIDCSINVKKQKISRVKCKLCAPTGRPLYIQDLYKDKGFDPCMEIKEEQVGVETVTVEVDGQEKKYFYKDNVIYEFNSDIGGYIPMRKSNPLYAKIIRKILNL